MNIIGGDVLVWRTVHKDMYIYVKLLHATQSICFSFMFLKGICTTESVFLSSNIRTACSQIWPEPFPLFLHILYNLHALLLIFIYQCILLIVHVFLRLPKTLWRASTSFYSAHAYRWWSHIFWYNIQLSRAWSRFITLIYRGVNFMTGELYLT